MSNLAYRDNLFQHLFDFRRDFDQMFNRFFVTWPGNQELKSELGNMTAFVPPVDAYIDKDGKKFFCHVALPGVDPKEVTIQVQRNVLSIRGERKLTHETRNADLVHSEFVQGAFERNIALPEGVDGDKLTAEYRNGVLEITAPIPASAMPRRVEIKTVPTAKQFAAAGGN